MIILLLALSAPPPKPKPEYPITRDFLIGTYDYTWNGNLKGVLHLDKDGSFYLDWKAGDDLIIEVGDWTLKDGLVTLNNYKLFFQPTKNKDKFNSIEIGPVRDTVRLVRRKN